MKLNNKQNNYYDLEGNFIKEYKSITLAAQFIKPNNIKSMRTSISNCLKEKSKSAGKFKWKYNIK